jgi:hypothetical protein
MVSHDIFVIIANNHGGTIFPKIVLEMFVGNGDNQ